MSLDPLRENCQTRFWNSKKNNQPCWDVDRSLRACVQAVCLERALEYLPLVSWGQGDAVEFSVQERSKYFRWVPRLDFLKQQPPPVNKLFKEKKNQLPPQALRFSYRGGRDTRVAYEETQGFMGRRINERQRRLARFLLPAFLCAQIFIEWEKRLIIHD